MDGYDRSYLHNYWDLSLIQKHITRVKIPSPFSHAFFDSYPKAAFAITFSNLHLSFSHSTFFPTISINTPLLTTHCIINFANYEYHL